MKSIMKENQRLDNDLFKQTTNAKSRFLLFNQSQIFLPSEKIIRSNSVGTSPLKEYFKIEKKDEKIEKITDSALTLRTSMENVKTTRITDKKKDSKKAKAFDIEEEKINLKNGHIRNISSNIFNLDEKNNFYRSLVKNPNKSIEDNKKQLKRHSPLPFEIEYQKNIDKRKIIVKRKIEKIEKFRYEQEESKENNKSFIDFIRKRNEKGVDFKKKQILKSQSMTKSTDDINIITNNANDERKNDKMRINKKDVLNKNENQYLVKFDYKLTSIQDVKNTFQKKGFNIYSANEKTGVNMGTPNAEFLVKVDKPIEKGQFEKGTFQVEEVGKEKGKERSKLEMRLIPAKVKINEVQQYIKPRQNNINHNVGTPSSFGRVASLEKDFNVSKYIHLHIAYKNNEKYKKIESEGVSARGSK